MKVYVAVIEDRHTDPDPQVFSTPEAAISWAREEARSSAKRPGDFVEHDVEGFLYFADYSSESDCVWVVERTLDEPGS